MTKVIHEVFIQSWWVILFILICFFCYEEGLRKKERDFQVLQKQYQELFQRKEVVMNIHEELVGQIRSQQDPSFIEMLLLKELGLVPEGVTKVVFKNLQQNKEQ